MCAVVQSSSKQVIKIAFNQSKLNNSAPSRKLLVDASGSSTAEKSGF